VKKKGVDLHRRNIVYKYEKYCEGKVKCIARLRSRRAMLSYGAQECPHQGNKAGD